MKKTAYSLIFVSILLFSCSNLKNNPPLNFNNEFLNQQILLRAPDFSNTFNTHDPINLELKYNSNNEIVFPNDYNLRIFIQSDGEWVEISEKPTVRLPAGDVVLSSTKQMPAVEDIFVSPDLIDINATNKLRIYIIGDMKTDDGIKEVAAYTDVILHP